MVNKIKQLGSSEKTVTVKMKVDEKRETLHNLTSLLQRTQRFVLRSKMYRISSLKINSR